jgi:hypothetical protein
MFFGCYVGFGLLSTARTACSLCGAHTLIRQAALYMHVALLHLDVNRLRLQRVFLGMPPL